MAKTGDVSKTLRKRVRDLFHDIKKEVNAGTLSASWLVAMLRNYFGAH